MTTKNLPSLRYDIFIKAFEKKVAAAQAAIEAVRSMEQPYNAVKDAMEAARLPNDQSINIDARAISVHLQATPADTLAGLEALAMTIGRGLLAVGMHRDGEPATSHGGSSCCLWFCWSCRTERAGSFQVRLYVGVPHNGLRDCEVIKSERHTVEADYQLKRIELPSHPAPSNIKTTADRREAALAAEEIPF
jgi:hypothetical protein